MEIRKIEKQGCVCAHICDENVVISDVRTALDVLMAAKYEIGVKDIIIAKELITEDFFILSNGLAGEILQKYVNYGGRIAIYGDYSSYTSKPLKDFIFESNKGKDVFLVTSLEEALAMMLR